MSNGQGSQQYLKLLFETFLLWLFHLVPYEPLSVPNEGMNFIERGDFTNDTSDQSIGMAVFRDFLLSDGFQGLLGENNLIRLIKYLVSLIFEIFLWLLSLEAWNQVSQQLQLLYKFQNSLQMSHVMRKPCFCHMRTTKLQVSLCICAEWSVPLLFAA